ncbi:MAG: hypothetical protein WC058_07870 [Phycisphaeraceae bacterium]
MPVLFALYRKRADCTAAHPFRTRRRMAATLVGQAVQVLPRVIGRVCEGV